MWNVKHVKIWQMNTCHHMTGKPGPEYLPVCVCVCVSQSVREVSDASHIPGGFSQAGAACQDLARIPGLGAWVLEPTADVQTDWESQANRKIRTKCFYHSWPLHFQPSIRDTVFRPILSFISSKIRWSHLKASICTCGISLILKCVVRFVLFSALIADIKDTWFKI